MPLSVPTPTADIADAVWAYVSRLLTNPQAAELANLDATVSSREAEADALKRYTALLAAIGAIPIIPQPSYGEVLHYPFAAPTVIDADPAFTYSSEVSEADGIYKEVGYFDFDENVGDIKSIFVNFVWAQKITGAGSGKVKWQVASGSNGSPGTYVDITDEVSCALTVYTDFARSGVIHLITGAPTKTPFTIRCLVKNDGATSAEAKIKSNSYIRVTYKAV
jgi:hypothetical protein